MCGPGNTNGCPHSQPVPLLTLTIPQKVVAFHREENVASGRLSDLPWVEGSEGREIVRQNRIKRKKVIP